MNIEEYKRNIDEIANLKKEKDELDIKIKVASSEIFLRDDKDKSEIRKNRKKAIEKSKAIEKEIEDKTQLLKNKMKKGIEDEKKLYKANVVSDIVSLNESINKLQNEIQNYERRLKEEIDKLNGLFSEGNAVDNSTRENLSLNIDYYNKKISENKKQIALNTKKMESINKLPLKENEGEYNILNEMLSIIDKSPIDACKLWEERNNFSFIIAYEPEKVIDVEEEETIDDELEVAVEDEEPEETIDDELEVAVEEEEPEETIDDELEVAVEEEEPEIVISKKEEARKKFVEKAREGLDEANKRKTEKNSAPETQTTSISDEPKVPTSPATEPEVQTSATTTPAPEPETPEMDLEEKLVLLWLQLIAIEYFVKGTIYNKRLKKEFNDEEKKLLNCFTPEVQEKISKIADELVTTKVKEFYEAIEDFSDNDYIDEIAIKEIYKRKDSFLRELDFTRYKKLLSEFDSTYDEKLLSELFSEIVDLSEISTQEIKTIEENDRSYFMPSNKRKREFEAVISELVKNINALKTSPAAEPKVQTPPTATPTSEPKPEVQTPGPKTNVIIPEPVSHSTKSADEKTHVVKPFRIDENQKIVYGGEKVEVSKIQINGDLRKDTDTMYKLADNLINKIGGKDERYKFDDDVERKIKAYSSKYENLDDDKKFVGRQRLICGMLCEIYGIGINGDVEDYINGITADDYKSGNINKKVTDFIKDLSDGIYGTDGKKVKEQEKVYVTPNPNGKSQKTPSEPPKSKPSPNGQKTNSNPSKANNEPPRPVNSNANKQDNSDDRKLLQDITMCVMSLMIGKEIPFSSTSQKTVDKINEIVKYMKESKDLNDMNFNDIMFNQVLQKFYGLDESQAAIIINNSGIIKDKADIFISKISHNCMLNGKKIDPECKINIAKDYTIKQWGKTWDTMALNLSNKELQKYNQEKTAQDDLEQGTELPVKAEKKGVFQRIKDALSKLKEKFTKTSDSENSKNIDYEVWDKMDGDKNAFDTPNKTDFQEAEEVVKNVKIQNRFQRFFSNVKERFTKSNEKNSDIEKNNDGDYVTANDKMNVYRYDGNIDYNNIHLDSIDKGNKNKNENEKGD